MKLKKVNAPMLLWAGMKDENVTPDQTMAFYSGLVRNHKPVIALLCRIRLTLLSFSHLKQSCNHFALLNL